MLPPPESRRTPTSAGLGGAKNPAVALGEGTTRARADQRRRLAARPGHAARPPVGIKIHRAARSGGAGGGGGAELGLETSVLRTFSRPRAGAQVGPDLEPALGALNACRGLSHLTGTDPRPR